MTTLNFDELANKSKDELDRIKLAQEITGYKEQRAFERKKFSSESVRLIIIAALSAFVSLLSLGTTVWMKYLDKNTSQTDEVRKHIDNLKDRYFATINGDEKKNVACQIAGERNPNNDKDITKDIQDFTGKCDTLTQTVNNTILATDSLNKITSDVKSDTSAQIDEAFINQSNQNDQLLISLQNKKIAATQPSERQALAKQAEQTTTNFIKSIPNVLLQSAVRLTDTIHKNVAKQITVTTENGSTTTDNKAIVKDYGTPWFKEGYFLQFDDMRILLQYLDKQLGIQVQVCQTTGTAACNNVIVTKQWIAYDKPLIITVGSNKYQVSLKAIDHAGNNPFKLAAYINVVKLGS